MTVCEGCILKAVDGQHLRALQRLLELGVPPDSGVVPGGSPLSFAVDQGNVAAVTLLLAYGADPDLSSSHSEGSPLDHARTQRRTDIIRLLEEASGKRR
jgi:ankyrin repeat protein